MVKAPSEETVIAVMANDVARIKDDIKSLTVKIDNMTGTFVTQKEFAPVRNIVFGLVTLIVIAVVTALIGLVVFPIKKL